MATARLRKAFRYPEDEVDAAAMDEHEQEKLIADLKDHDATNSALYLRIYTLVPLICALYFLTAIFAADTPKDQGVALLSFSSILVTTYLLVMLPYPAPDEKGKKVYLVEVERTPVERYLPGLNIALTCLLSLSAALDWRQGRIEAATREALPGVFLAITLFVKEQLRPLDWHELEQARYELKGA